MLSRQLTFVMHNLTAKFNSLKNLESSEFPNGDNSGARNLPNDSILKAALRDFVETNIKSLSDIVGCEMIKEIA